MNGRTMVVARLLIVLAFIAAVFGMLRLVPKHGAPSKRVVATSSTEPAPTTTELPTTTTTEAPTTTTEAPVQRVRSSRPVVTPQAPQRAQRTSQRRSGGGMPAGCIRKYESGGRTDERGNYSERGGGAYQIQRGTWGGYGGYARADDAPPHVQDERAQQLWAERPGHWGAQRGRCPGI